MVAKKKKKAKAEVVATVSEVKAYLGRPDVVEHAEKCQIVWARVGSYPLWPAQMMVEEAVDFTALPKSKKRDPSTYPVMFFGDCARVAWVKEKCLMRWGEGVEKGRMDVGSVSAALKELRTFMEYRTDGACRAKEAGATGGGEETGEEGCIKGWWCAGPEEVPYPWPHPEDDDEDDGDDKEASRPSSDRMPKASIVNGRLKLSEAKRERLVKSFGADAFSGKNVFPEYVHVSRNAWTVPRPRQFKSDEIEVCTCYPVPMSVDSKRRLGIRMEGKDAANLGTIDRTKANASPTLIGCGHDCLNRTSFMHCAPKACPCGDLCTNKPFYRLETPKLEMVLTKNKGWGVQASEAIEKGTFVVEYAGEVIDEAEMSRRMAESRAQGHHHFYMMDMGGGLVIDAMYKGNVARLLNSSCAPNCETQKWHDAATGEVRIGIFALRNIRAGEELCYDYNFEHIIDNSGAKYSCQCGAPNCRGSIDTKLRLSTKDEGRRIEIWWEDDKVYYPGVHAKYDVRRGTSGRSKIVYDDGHVEWILLNEHKYRWLDEGKTLKRRRNAAMITGQAPEENVGGRIDVWWDEDNCYYPGRMTAYDADRGVASISYDDGVQEDLKLCDHEYRWITECKDHEGLRNDVEHQDVDVIEAADKHQDEKSLVPSGSDTQIMIIDACGGEDGGDEDEEEVSEQEGGENEGHGDRGVLEPGLAAVKEALRSFFESCTSAELQHVAARFCSEPDMDTGISDDHVDPDGAETENTRTTCAGLFEAVSGAPAEARQAMSSTIRRVLGQALESFHTNGRPVSQIFEPPLNPGAEQTAGSLHGNGRGGAGASGGREASVSSRGRKRQKKVFGTDFEQEEDAGRHNIPKSQRGSLSPVRQRPKTAPKIPPTSPGMEAASMLAQMAHSKVSTVDSKPRSKSRSAFRGCGPTPPSTGLPKRTILVAKRLTNSDVTKGRVLLPRAAVESNLSFAVGRAHSLVAKDHEGNTWEFTLQSWANGIESRRVFVLEHAGEYIKYHVLKIEDVIGISTTEEGEFMIEFNTDEVCTAAESQQAARAGGQSAVNKSLPAIRPGSINPLVKHNSGRCTRSVHCNKPAGHPGFCMRTPASNRGQKKTGGRGRGRGQVSRGRGKQIPSLHRRYLRGDYNDWDEDDDGTQESGPDSQPGSARYRRGDSDDEIFRRGGTLTPRFPNQDYFGNSKPEFGEAYGNDNMAYAAGDERSGPGIGGSHALDKSRAPLPKYPAAGGPLPLPPELGPGVPPIFVGAPDAVPQYPPQLRSPLRPQIKPTSAIQQDAALAAGGMTQQQLKSVPHMGLKDDLIDGMSPHAYHGQRNDWNMFEGYSPTVAKFDPHKQAPFSGGMPAAPLPLFGGAPPPLIRTSKPGSATGAKEQGVTTPRGTHS